MSAGKPASLLRVLISENLVPHLAFPMAPAYSFPDSRWFRRPRLALLSAIAAAHAGVFAWFGLFGPRAVVAASRDSSAQFSVDCEHKGEESGRVMLYDLEDKRHLSC